MHRVVLHLSLIEHIGPAAGLRLIRALGSTEQSLSSIYMLSISELQSLAGLSEERARTLYEGLADKSLLERELALINEYEISVITVLDENYPVLLKNIYLPPLVLYVKGHAVLDSQRHLGMVGSRKADSYGQAVVSMLVCDLVKNGWVIVSGGAVGIDGMAHQATIDADGTTIAVLGSGLLRPYPKVHKNLFTKIIESGGALVSPFPLTMEALPGMFPARNRIIAGLSRGCVVIQAAIPSGALITAQYALNEGREVFAVPGTINNPLSAGCHKLISEGATLVGSAADILDAFVEVQPKDRQLAFISQSSEPIARELLTREPVIPQSLTPEQYIIQLCAQPISFDELIVRAGGETPVIQDILCELSLEGKLIQDRVGLWCKV